MNVKIFVSLSYCIIRYLIHIIRLSFLTNRLTHNDFEVSNATLNLKRQHIGQTDIYPCWKCQRQMSTVINDPHGQTRRVTPRRNFQRRFSGNVRSFFSLFVLIYFLARIRFRVFDCISMQQSRRLIINFAEIDASSNLSLSISRLFDI